MGNAKIYLVSTCIIMLSIDDSNNFVNVTWTIQLVLYLTEVILQLCL